MDMSRRRSGAPYLSVVRIPRISANHSVTARVEETLKMTSINETSSHDSSTSDDEHPELEASAETTQLPTSSAAAVEDPASSASSSGKELTEIDRAYLLVGKHKREHVCSLLGPSMQRNEDAISNLLSHLESLKKELRDWAAGEIRARMLDEARKNKLPVRHFGEIKRWWAKNCTANDQKVIARIAFGIWDDDPGWEFVLEENYMQLKKWKYKQASLDSSASTLESVENKAPAGGPSIEPKGFVSRLITNVKGDQVKQLQEAGKKSHGINITISRSSSQINKDNKWKKRKKGTFVVTESETTPRKKRSKRASRKEGDGHQDGSPSGSGVKVYLILLW